MKRIPWAYIAIPAAVAGVVTCVVVWRRTRPSTAAAAGEGAAAKGGSGTTPPVPGPAH